MHFVPRWPRANEISLPKDPQSQGDYFRSVLVWGKESGAEEFVFLSLEEWPPVQETVLQKESFSIRENVPLPENVNLSFLLPPILLGNSLVFWISEHRSLVHSFFQILEKLSGLRTQASELLGCNFSQEPKLVWTEKNDSPHSVLITDILWEKKDKGKRVSIPLSFSQTFFLGSLFGIKHIDSLEWAKDGRSELESATFHFLSERVKSKYGNVLSALGDVSQTETWNYRPHSYFSLPLHLLIHATVLTEAWEQLVSLWIEERPRKEDALKKIGEWTEKESGSQTMNGFEALFEERTVRLLDKYSGRSDRFLLQRLEQEYFDWKKCFELESSRRRIEIDEILIPSLLARVSTHSQFSWPEELHLEWEEIGKIYRQSLENLLLERKKIASEISYQDGKSPESWNILLSYRSE